MSVDDGDDPMGRRSSPAPMWITGFCWGMVFMFVVLGLVG